MQCIVLQRLGPVLVLLLVVCSIHPVAAQADERCFPETGQCISGRFRQYWEQNGGLPVFGFPVAPLTNEVNPDTGQTYVTQWFERNRFELHPENARPYDVLLGRLGDARLRQLGRTWQAEPRESGPKSGCRWFAQTGHNVCDQAPGIGFKTYWETHGLEFDGRRGTSEAESLALFGLALTEPRMETNASGHTVLTQWFERARFEWHPNNPEPFKVLLGLLGTEVREHPCLTATIVAPQGADTQAGATSFTVQNRVVIAWEPSNCVMTVEAYQQGRLTQKYFGVRSGQEVEIGAAGSGDTEIKIWKEGAAQPADQVWVRVR